MPGQPTHNPNRNCCGSAQSRFPACTSGLHDDRGHCGDQAAGRAFPAQALDVIFVGLSLEDEGQAVADDDQAGGGDGRAAHLLA